MLAGIVFFVRLALVYLTALPAGAADTCNLLGPELCAEFNKDPFTVLTTMWAALQLTWPTMLVCVQLIQIARALTTRENMKGHDHFSAVAEVVTAAAVAGTTSLEGAQVESTAADGSTSAPSRSVHNHPRKEGLWQQWKTLLGLDTFLATAMYGSRAEEVMVQQRQNPWTRGVSANCSDFFCDPAPVFGKRQTGQGLLAGQPIDWTATYEVPPREPMLVRRGGYEAVGADEEV